MARRDITPSTAIYAKNWGAAKTSRASVIHRRLLLTTLLIHGGRGQSPFALITLDLGWWRSAEEEHVLAEAVRSAGIGEGRFLIAMSHTHSGPSFCPGDAGKPGGSQVGKYLQRLASDIRESIQEALQNWQSGSFDVAVGSCFLAANRDLKEPKGSRYLVGWNPDGLDDDTLLVGRLTTARGKCLAILVNYACHPTTLGWGNRALSPDFIGAMRETVEADMQAPCLFLQGASGDLAPRFQYASQVSVADRAGKCLAHAVLSALHGMPPPGRTLQLTGVVESGAPLAVWSHRKSGNILADSDFCSGTMAFPVKDDLPSQEELKRRFGESHDAVEKERLHRKILLRESMGSGKAYHSPYVVWRLGEIVMVGVAGEYYAELQRQLRMQTKSPVFVVTIANACKGYVVPREIYAHDIYACWQSPFAAGAFELTLKILRQEITKILRPRQDSVGG